MQIGRLVERGVRFVELIDTGSSNNWDAHGDMMSHVGLAKNVDQPIGALLADLKARGMLDETLVLVGGEFGRTPTVELGGDGKATARRWPWARMAPTSASRSTPGIGCSPAA